MGIWQAQNPEEIVPSVENRTAPAREVSDESLLTALAEGIPWAMEPLYQRYCRLLHSLACRMVGDRQVAEDLVQEAFLALWQHAASYSPQAGPVRGWLVTLLRRRAIDILRGMQRRSCWKEIPWETIEWEDAIAIPDAWDEVWSSAQRVQVREALQQVPAEQRLVIILAYFRGWTHVEIAQHCQIPLGTVKARLRLGLLHLKRALSQQGVGEIPPATYSTRKPTRPRPGANIVIQATQQSCATGYEVCYDGSSSCFAYTEWETLVNQIEAFEFQGTDGSFLARKEIRAHGRAYWHALTWGSGGRRKTYLGRSADLTLPRLEAVARQLQEERL